MSQQGGDIFEVIQACVAGDPSARRRFQEEYGEDIYNFPVKICGLPFDQASDFYVYVFENNRIFARLRTFAGRNNIQFRTFLSYYVLKHLFLRWQQTRKEVETLSLYTPVGDTTKDERVLADVLPDSSGTEIEQEESMESGPAADIWHALSPEERLDLKLLSLIECDLEPEEVRLLAQLSSRSIRDTLALLAAVQEELKQKDERLSRLRDELDSVWGWILLQQKELQEINEKIRLLKDRGDAAGSEKLFTQRRETERALAKRSRQREKVVAKMHTYKITTPYKDIARLLNVPVGTVCWRIARLRERLVQKFGDS